MDSGQVERENTEDSVETEKTVETEESEDIYIHISMSQHGWKIEGSEQSENSGNGNKENLISSKDIAALKEMMYERLEICGWKDFVRKLARLVIQYNGLYVTNERAAAEIVPYVLDVLPLTLLKDLEDRVSEILYDV